MKGLKMKEFLLKLDDENSIIITDIKPIKNDGILPIDYLYSGNLLENELQELMTKRINELIENMIYGELNNDW